MTEGWVWRCRRGGGRICAKPTENGAWGRGGPQVNHEGTALYSEGLVRKSQLFRKEMEVGLSSGRVWGQKGHLRGSGHIHGGGGQSGWWRRCLSLLPRDHAKRRAWACTGRPREAQGSREPQAAASQWRSGTRRPQEVGAGGGEWASSLWGMDQEDRLAPLPPHVSKRAKDKAGSQRCTIIWGPYFLLFPPAWPPPHPGSWRQLGIAQWQVCKQTD